MTVETISDVDLCIKEKEEELKGLKDTRIKMTQDRKTSSEAGQLAILIHSEQCRYNHTDGCSWHYEMKNNIPDWGAHAHSSYFEKATRMLKANDYNTIVSVMKSMKG